MIEELGTWAEAVAAGATRGHSAVLAAHRSAPVREFLLQSDRVPIAQPDRVRVAQPDRVPIAQPDPLPVAQRVAGGPAHEAAGPDHSGGLGEQIEAARQALRAARPTPRPGAVAG